MAVFEIVRNVLFRTSFLVMLVMKGMLRTQSNWYTTTDGCTKVKSLWNGFLRFCKIRNFWILSPNKRLGHWATCNMMLTIVLVSIMPSLLGQMRPEMVLKRHHPENSGCVLRATLLSNETASISLLVQRKIPFVGQYYPRSNIPFI